MPMRCCLAMVLAPYWFLLGSWLDNQLLAFLLLQKELAVFRDDGHWEWWWWMPAMSPRLPSPIHSHWNWKVLLHLPRFCPILWLAAVQHQEDLRFELAMSILLRGLSKSSYWPTKEEKNCTKAVIFFWDLPRQCICGQAGLSSAQSALG